MYDIPIDTKANPWYNNDFESGKLGQLNKINLTNQLNNSLNDMGIDKCNIFYLHCPDNETSIFETLETCNELYRKDKCRFFCNINILIINIFIES